MARTTGRQWNGSHWFYRRPAVGAFLTLLALALLLSALLSRYESVLLSKLRSDLGALLNPHCDSLSISVAHRLSLLNALKAYVETEEYKADNGMERGFPIFAAALCEGVKGIRTVTISPAGVPRYVFPLEGNQKVLGLNFLSDRRPVVHESIQKALGTRKVVFAGPYELVTGELGFVGRLAIFKEDEFWGIVSTSVELAPLLESAGFNNLPGQYSLAIRRQNGKTFFGQSSVFENDPVVMQIDVSGESWEVGAHPIDGWHSAVGPSLLPVKAAGVLVIMLLSGIVYLVGIRHISLAGAVKARTEELAVSEELFRTLFQASPLAIVSAEMGGVVTSWNLAAEKIFGWKESEVIGKFLPTLSSEQVVEFEKIGRRLLAGGEISGLEVVRRRKDGSLIDISLSVAPLRNREGQVDGHIGIMEDITERKKSDRELRESRTRMRLHNVIAGNRLDAAPVEETISRALKEIGAAFERYHAGYLIVDSNGHLQLVSSFTPEGMPEFQECESDLSPIPAYLMELLKNRALTIPDVTQDTLFSAPDQFPGGAWIQAVLAVPADLWDDLTGVLFIVSGESTQWSDHEIVTLREVSDHLAVVSKEAQTRKQQAELEAQLIQTQKIESIGCLAGGVAHDFNNLLLPIIAYSDMLLEEIGPQHPFFPRLKQINEAGEKAKKLTHQLLAFGRKQLLDVKPVNLNTVVSEFEGMLQRLIGEDVRVETSLSAEISLLKGDVAQIEQILLNLAVNARDAMPAGGTLKIETSEEFLDKERVRTKAGISSGRYVMLAVSDSGSGMDHETQSRIFEPFFTTKEKGKGTGLGLSTVHGIVKQHEGHVFVYSEQGKGTTFKIYFPAAEAEENALEPAQKPEICPGTETIMVVEDDESVRSLTVILLSRCGYRVLAALSPEEALKIALEHHERIDLLLTDLIMPQMNGRDLYISLQSFRPETKALFMSGYTADVIGQHGILDKDIHFISKPFAMHSLSSKIREALDG